MLTLLWDVDDVLNDLTRRWFEDAWLVQHPGVALTFDQLTEQPATRLLGASLDEYLDSLDEYRNRHYRNLVPRPDIVDWFAVHGSHYRHAALTATPIKHAPAVAEWVMRHFGHWIRAIAVVPSSRADDRHPQYDLDKGSAAEWLGFANVFIDDNLANIEAVAARGLRTIVVPRPWNSATRPITEAIDLLGAAHSS